MRVDMFDVEIESLRWFSTFTQRSLGDVQEVEIAPAAELAAEHRGLRIGRGGRRRPHRLLGADGGEDASQRPDIAELLPVERFGALLDLVGAETELVVAAEEELAPVLSDHWTDVCAAFGDEDAHHLYVSPESIHAALGERARIWLSAMASGQEIELRAQSADTAARSLAEAEPELEKLVRSGYRTVVTFPRRGEGERAAYNLGRLKATWLGRGSGRRPPGARAVAAVRRGLAARGLRRAAAEARGVSRAPPAAPAPRRATRWAGRRGGRRPGRGSQGSAALVHRAARGGHRRARGPRRGAVRGF